MKNTLSIIFKVMMWVLVVASVLLLIAGFWIGFETHDGAAVNALLYWAYAMVGLALACVFLDRVCIQTVNDPMNLVKLLILLVAVCAICFVVYLFSPGNPAMGLIDEQPSHFILKVTDTILNLTYLSAAVAILSIVVGEIVMAVRK